MKYRVSIAILRPLNYEIEVEAESQGDAFNRALTAWNGDDESISGYVSEEYVGDDLLYIGGDIHEAVDADHWGGGIPRGVHIEPLPEPKEPETA